MKRDKVDSIFSRYIKLLCDGYCTRCKKLVGVNSRGLHCAHFISRGVKRLRYTRDNATALCYGCHRYIDHPNHQAEKEEFFLNLIGQQRWEELHWIKDHPDGDKLDKEAIYKDLKEKVKLLEHGD
jgi:hypothetical protein